MATRIGLEILLIVLLVLANGAFAMSEIALVSSKKVRLQHLARRGSRRAAAAVRLMEHPDRFLSTVQIGITLIGVFAGAFGGATIADQLDEHLETIPGLGPYSEAIAMAAVVIGISYLSLVLGELVPKRLALHAPERIATAVAGPMRWLSRIAAPAVYLLTSSTRGVLRLLRVRQRTDPPVTEEDLRALLWLGAKAGTIEPEERDIIDRAFRLDARRVTSVMTPRVDLEWLDSRKPLEALREQVARSSHDWFPVAAERIDDLAGVVRGKELWTRAEEASRGVNAIVYEPLYVPESASALSVLQRFRETRTHFVVVVDEFGGIEGIVTPVDILEALVGELPEIGDVDEPDIVTRDDGSLSVDAATDLAELKLALGIDFIAGQKDGYQTVGGYVVEHLGSQHRIGASFVVNDIRFEVLDTDGWRIDRVLVSRAEHAAE